MDLELQRALDSIDVETLLEREGIDYRRSYGTRGLQANLRECPACGEGGFKTYVGLETGLGNCFHGSCGKKFNRFWLMKHISGLAGAELDTYIKTVAEQQGWMPKKPRAELVRRALELPSKTYPLPIDGRNLAYLQERGVDLLSCEHFRLHFCSGGWWGYKLDSGEEKWVSYNDRVIIPITTLDGTMVSFQGRDITGEQEPKYLFPVGFAVAGSELFNADHFQDGVTTHAVVGEGAFDAIAIHQALRGAKGTESMLALATFGMHLSAGPGGQIEKFRQLRERGLRHVTFMWDAEGKAIRGAIKAGLELIGEGLTVSIARLPPGHDPAQGPNKRPTPPAKVIEAIFTATALSRLSAIRLATEAARMTV